MLRNVCHRIVLSLLLGIVECLFTLHIYIDVNEPKWIKDLFDIRLLSVNVVKIVCNMYYSSLKRYLDASHN